MREQLRGARALFTKPSWLSEGEDPDYRFSLANERTFLAWIRTSLALLAGAVAVVQLVPRFAVPGSRTVLGIVLATSGGVLAAYSYRRWAANERAMRLGQSLPHTALLAVAAVSVSTVALIVLALVIVHHA
jgi:putative membrane protein